MISRAERVGGKLGIKRRLHAVHTNTIPTDTTPTKHARLHASTDKHTHSQHTNIYMTGGYTHTHKIQTRATYMHKHIHKHIHESIHTTTNDTCGNIVNKEGSDRQI